MNIVHSFFIIAMPEFSLDLNLPDIQHIEQIASLPEPSCLLFLYRLHFMISLPGLIDDSAVA